MVRDVEAWEERLLTDLAGQWPMTSVELQSRHRRSQATLSRALARLAPRGVVRVGAGRRTRYALCRPLKGLVFGQQPLYRHGVQGDVHEWGSLTWLGDGRVHVEGQGQEWRETGRWPWFLAPLRLEGYLGRLWARRTHLGQVLGPRPDEWGIEEQLYAAVTQLYDGPGAFTIGSPEGGAAATSNAVDAAERGAEYDRIAQDDGYRGLAGSSAAGEQAKFLIDIRQEGEAATDWRSVLVKFSSAHRGSPFGDRWHDLLHAEAMALRILAAAGGPVSEARVLETANRTYLESVRFDRTPAHGRRHAVALKSIHEAFLPGQPRVNWSTTCRALVAQRMLSPEDARIVAVWLAFGRMIGNDDMHFGNLSLWADAPQRPSFELAPCYDMLPMRYRPQVSMDGFGPTPLALDTSTGVDRDAWHEALPLAEQFWAAVSGHAPCTAAFRGVAAENAQRVRDLAGRAP